MIAIISDGALVALCEAPRYIKVNEKTGAYVEAAAEDAIGIAVGGKLYNLPGSDAIAGSPVAVVTEGDVSEYVFRNRVKIVEVEVASKTGFAEVEDAVCELDAIAEERISAAEDALCELDAIINGG